MALHSPFDFEQIFVVDVAGNPEIFSFLAMLLISLAMSKFSLPSKVALPLFALFAIVMATYMQGMFVLVILLAGISTFYALSKIGR